MIWWIRSDTAGSEDRTVSFMATFWFASMPRFRRTRTRTSPTNVPLSSVACERAFGGTASLPSHGAMPRIVLTASTASSRLSRVPSP